MAALVIVIVAVLLIGGGVWFAKKSSINKQVPRAASPQATSSVSEEQPQPTSSAPQVVNNPATNWKVFTSAQGWITLSYPNEWVIATPTAKVNETVPVLVQNYLHDGPPIAEKGEAALMVNRVPLPSGLSASERDALLTANATPAKLGRYDAYYTKNANAVSYNILVGERIYLVVVTNTSNAQAEKVLGGIISSLTLK